MAYSYSLILVPRWTKRNAQVGLCQTYDYFNQCKHRGLLASLLTAKDSRSDIDLVRTKSASLFGYRKSEIEKKFQGSF